MAKTIFMTNFELLCSEHGYSMSYALQKMGLSKAIMTNWKNGYLPNAVTQQKIAAFFNISVEDLMGADGLEKAPTITEDQLEFIKAFNKLKNDDDKAFLMRLMNLLSKDG